MTSSPTGSHGTRRVAAQGDRLSRYRAGGADDPCPRGGGRLRTKPPTSPAGGFRRSWGLTVAIRDRIKTLLRKIGKSTPIKRTKR